MNKNRAKPSVSACDGSRLSRRGLLRQTTAMSAAVVAGMATGRHVLADDDAASGPAVRKGRLKQDLVSWPFMSFGDQWDLDGLCRAAVALGCPGIELVGPDQWPTMKRYGLTCALATNGMPGPPFVKGLNNPRYQQEVLTRTRERIEACAAADVPAVIAFTGFKYLDVDDPSQGEIPPDEGADNTVAGLKELARHAERHGVTVCMEHLNSRVPDDDYRGHPGYQGDRIDYCAEIIRRVGSPRVKLLFDIYHVQIMDGDIIARIREYGPDLIGHIHTAGVPGRGELDDQQEIFYPPIMRALLDVGYEGYVGQEFIPTRNAMDGLRQAVALCDV